MSQPESKCHIVQVIGDSLERQATQLRSPRPRFIRLRRGVSASRSNANEDLYVIAEHAALLNDSTLSRITGYANQDTRFMVIPDESPRASLPAIISRLRIRTTERIHMPELRRDKPEKLLQRLLEGLSHSSEYPVIVDAWWEADTLVVMPASFRKLRVPVSNLPKLPDVSKQIRDNFEIDEYGEYIYWPDLDMHIGWSGFIQAVDPAAGIEARQKSKEFNRRYGLAIRSLREQAGKRQADILGLNDRTVRRIEKGQCRVTAKALEYLARAHNMSANDYLDALATQIHDTSNTV